jgi:serine/threonine-protein kinase
MSAAVEQAKSIFLHAVEIAAGEERRAYVAGACGADTGLRHEVEELLTHHGGLGSFLEARGVDVPTGSYGPASAPVAVEGPGTAVGPYKLLEQIGEGGFGVVFMAEQTRPVRRKVALKVLKPGMDTRQVVARFEAERQALALMDHPNIAKVFDGGQTASGRPYFVMELVKGTPITEFCDLNHLTPRQRLELFVSVCQAIQHAHQKGIIHRDLKPSNVLVTMHDTTPVVKVIDFGVAKALGQELTDKTLFTGFAQMIGTPLYMSPEQAGQSGLDIDTRSDIYSLGVLLYELLTGTTPFDKEWLKRVSYEEIRRIIREEEAPRPSTRISTLGPVAATVSANRQSDPKKLGRQLRGELDWIVMKALEKDRNRRYESAGALAQDIRRYLADEPVLAGPPSAWYRLRKLAQRHRARLTAVSVLGLALTVAAGAIAWQVRDRAEAARERLERQRRLSTRVDMAFADVERLEREQQWPEALAAAKRADADLAGGEADEASRRRVRELLSHLEFIARLDRIRQRDGIDGFGRPVERRAAEAYLQAFRDYGVDVSQLSAEEAATRLKARPELAVPLSDALYDWSQAQRIAGEIGDTGWKTMIAIARGVDDDPLRQRIADTWLRPITPELQTQLRQLAASVDVRTQRPVSLCLLARHLWRASLPDVASRILRDGLQAHPGDYWLNRELADNLSKKESPEALRYYAAAAAIRPDSAAAQNALGLQLYRQGKPQEAAASFRKASELAPNLWIHRYYLGLVLLDMLNQPAEAEVCMNKVIELDPKHGRGYLSLGTALADQNKLDEAITCYSKAIEVGAPSSEAHTRIGFALEQKGLIQEAIAEHQKAVGVKPTPAALVWLASAYGAIGQWDKATAQCEQAVKLGPQDVLNWHALAVSHVGAGHVEAYRGTCRQMIQRFGGTEQPEAAERTAGTCLLLPEAVDAADLDSARLLAERAVARTEDERHYRYYAGTKALADYRAGRPADAATWVKRYFANPTTIKKWGADWDARAFAILALAEHQLGRTKEAQAALGEAQTLIATKRPDFAKGRGGAPAQSFGWLFSQVLCREAETALGAKGKN